MNNQFYNYILKIKYLVIIILYFTLCSCESINKIENSICSDFKIEIEEKLFKEPIFVVKLQDAILKNLEIIKNPNKNNICLIKIKLITNAYETATTDGVTSRQSVKINVNYNISINNNTIHKNNFILFYGQNIIKQRYSNYKKQESVQNDIITNIASEIYKNVLSVNNK